MGAESKVRSWKPVLSFPLSLVGLGCTQLRVKPFVASQEFPLSYVHLCEALRAPGPYVLLQVSGASYLALRMGHLSALGCGAWGRWVLCGFTELNPNRNS